MQTHSLTHTPLHKHKCMVIRTNPLAYSVPLAGGRWVQYMCHCNTLQHTATHCNTLQHAATHCYTMQHTATHCNILQHTATCSRWVQYMCHCITLQHTATHCYTMQHTATTTSSITLYLLTGGRWVQCTRAQDLHRRQRAGSC